jgi:hypothetical protein
MVQLVKPNTTYDRGHGLFDMKSDPVIVSGRRFSSRLCVNERRVSTCRRRFIFFPARRNLDRGMGEMWMFGCRVVPSLRAGAWVLKFIVVYVLLMRETSLFLRPRKMSCRKG